MNVTKILFLSAILLSGFSLDSYAGPSAAEDCNLSDLVLDVDTSDPDAAVIGCAGQFDGNDATSDGWLASKDVWVDGVLSNDTSATVSTDTWLYLSKYEDGVMTEPSGAASLIDIAFENCKDDLGNTVACTGQWNVADLTFTIDPLVYDQFVLSSKANDFHSFYQIELLKNVTELIGTLSMVQKFALSHITLWARETSGSTTPPGTPPTVNASAPSTLGIMLMGLFVLVLRRRSKAL